MDTTLVDTIHKQAILKHFDCDVSYRILSVSQTTDLARKFKLRGSQVEIMALGAGVVPERYVRNMQMLSLQDQARLLSTRVSIVGLGGLGGGVIENLARIGVGTLNLVDGDVFEGGNLNRQALSTPKNLMKAKTQVAKRRIRTINPSIAVTVYNEFLNKDNALQRLVGSDVVIDCLDNLKTRFLLEATCKTLGIPLVSAAVAGASGHVTTIFPEDAGLELIYGPKGDTQEKGIETRLGTLPQSAAVLSALEASETVKILLKKGTLLRNKLLVLDLMDNTLEVLKLQ